MRTVTLCVIALELAKKFKLETKAGNDEFVTEACKVTCDFCSPAAIFSTESVKPSGCVLEHGAPNELDGSGESSGLVRYYGVEESKRYLGGDYTPICEALPCTIALQDVIKEATLNEAPLCAYGSTFTEAKQEEEGQLYLNFYYISAGSISLIVCLAYSCSKHCCCRAGVSNCSWPKWATHRLIWIGFVARLADLATDWAFWAININGELFGVKVDTVLSGRNGTVAGPAGWFDLTAEFDLERYQLAALIVCILGSVLTPIDIASKAPSCQTRRGGAGLNVGCCTLGRKVAVLVGLAVIVTEDIPQIMITSVYIKQLNMPMFDFSEDWTSSFLTVVNITLSVGSLLYNLFLVLYGFCNWKSATEKEADMVEKLQKQRKKLDTMNALQQETSF